MGGCQVRPAKYQNIRNVEKVKEMATIRARKANEEERIKEKASINVRM